VDSFDGKVSGQVSGVSQQQWYSQDSSNYHVLAPSLRSNSYGPSWANGPDGWHARPDSALSADLWDDLVLPRAVRSAWAPLVSRRARRRRDDGGRRPA